MQRRCLAIVVLLTCWLSLDAAPAFAYIDPGTGSALFYVVTGLLVALYFSVRGLYYRAAEVLFRIRHRDQKCGMAIHCEDPRYEITFLPVIHALSTRDIDLTFFTMYERDSSFDALPSSVTHRAISSGMVGYAYLNNVEATLLVTTTPQLDVMTFRRSRRVKHYTHIPHALGESRYVRPYAYDYFDSVLCCGPLLKANIRRIEELRGLPHKQLLDTGIPHYEELLQQASDATAPSGEVIVLVAPSWGPLSMFEAFGTDFVADIAARYKVVVRPHPQMRLSQPGLYEQVRSLRGVEIDTERTPSHAMSRANILVSDISGITHEFAFIYERPVLIVDRQLAIGGLEGELLGGDSELKQRCRNFIVPMPPDEINDVVSWIDRTLAHHDPRVIAEARSELVYNFGAASQTAAAQLAQIFRTTRSDGSEAGNVTRVEAARSAASAV